MRELTVKGLGTCQVRSGTARPCARPATAKLQGVPFCERCAREQETYFAIGEFTEAGGGRAGGESLAVAIELIKKIESCSRLRPVVQDHEPDAA